MTYKIKMIQSPWIIEVPFGVEVVYAASYEDACEKLGITPVSVDDLPDLFDLDYGVLF